MAVFIVLRRASNPNIRSGWHPKVYGRLYRRFEPEYYWWEILYLVRRICLTSFRVLMNDRRADVYLARTMQGWQGLCFLVTLIGALLAQFYAHPFKLEHMDLLDATLLCCLFCIVWISMAFEIALKETIEVEVLEGMVFLVVAVSCFISLFALVLDTYHSYIKVGSVNTASLYAHHSQPQVHHRVVESAFPFQILKPSSVHARFRVSSLMLSTNTRRGASHRPTPRPRRSLPGGWCLSCLL